MMMVSLFYIQPLHYAINIYLVSHKSLLMHMESFHLEYNIYPSSLPVEKRPLQHELWHVHPPCSLSGALWCLLVYPLCSTAGSCSYLMSIPRS